MTESLLALTNGLHTLAAVVFVGYFVLLSMLFLPILAGAEAGGRAALGVLSKRSRPVLYVSILVFALTGVYLTFVDPNYHGVGNFNTPWAVLMLVKHILIVAMIVIGFWYNGLLKLGVVLRSSPDNVQAIGQFRVYSNLMAFCGVLILFLTAFGQVK
jgi:uncharacterized membrane protein